MDRQRRQQRRRCRFLPVSPSSRRALLATQCCSEQPPVVQGSATVQQLSEVWRFGHKTRDANTSDQSKELHQLAANHAAMLNDLDGVLSSYVNFGHTLCL
jgi:hypothetical protein